MQGPSKTVMNGTTSCQCNKSVSQGEEKALEDRMLMLNPRIYCDRIVAVKFYSNNLFN